MPFIVYARPMDDRAALQERLATAVPADTGNAAAQLAPASHLRRRIINERHDAINTDM